MRLRGPARSEGPGRQWVDWVGTDFYANAPNFAGLEAFYRAYRGLPFLFGEWALWGADDPGFVNRLWGLPLYYGGQLLLAASVARL